MPSPFVYLYVFPTIPTSPDPGLTSRCGWTAKANPPALMRAKRRREGWVVSSGAIGLHRGNWPSGAVHLPIGYNFPGRWRVG